MSIMEDLQEKDRDIKTKLTEAKKSYTIIPHPPIKLWLPIVKYTSNVGFIAKVKVNKIGKNTQHSLSID